MLDQSEYTYLFQNMSGNSLFSHHYYSFVIISFDFSIYESITTKTTDFRCFHFKKKRKEIFLKKKTLCALSKDVSNHLFVICALETGPRVTEIRAAAICVGVSVHVGVVLLRDDAVQEGVVGAGVVIAAAGEEAGDGVEQIQSGVLR